MGRGLTLDTGALIALEAKRQRMKEVLAAARTLRVPITIPTVVIAEWWRGQKGGVARILDGVLIEELTFAVAKMAGEALVATRGSNAVDAVVVASAARRGDVVYTSDVHDLMRLSAHFPSVKVLGV